jgi:hypothetical protein
MTKLGLRRPINPGGVLGTHAAFRKEQIQKLCARLGVAFTDDPESETEMWAQVGERLALCEREFTRPKKRGRNRKPDNREAKLAELVEQEQARAGGTDRQALKRLVAGGATKITNIDTAIAQVSRGRKQLYALRYNAEGEDEFTPFDIERSMLPT